MGCDTFEKDYPEDVPPPPPKAAGDKKGKKDSEEKYQLPDSLKKIVGSPTSAGVSFGLITVAMVAVLPMYKLVQRVRQGRAELNSRTLVSSTGEVPEEATDGQEE